MTTSTANLDSISFPDLLRHAAWARRLAAQLVRDDDADDLVQDAWAAAGARPGGSRASGAPRKWLAGVMRNLARFRARSAARRRLREEAAGPAVHGDAGLSRPDEIAERVETQRLLAGLVLELPAVYRDVVLLRFYDDLPPRAIAARLGIPAGTARSRLSVGLAQLRERLRSSTDWRRSMVALAAGGGGGGGNWLTSWSAPARFAATGTAALVVAAVAIGAGPRLMRHGVAGQGTGAGEGAAARHLASEQTGQPRATRRPTLSLSLSLSREATEAVAAAGESAARAARAEAAERYQVPLGAGPMRGPADARVTILEFVDYQCPFTARAEAALARVLARYRDDVRFQVIHRPLPFHPQAESLARAALAAAEQGRFWQLHGALMAAGVLERWTPERLERVAREIGLDRRRFHQDLDGARVRGRAEVDEATASSVRIDGTPVFFVNGRALVGADAPAHMPAIIEEELARAETLAARGAEGAAALYNAAIAGGKPVLSELPPLPKGPTPPPSSTPRFERLFQEAMSCGPVLDAPAALDLSFQRPAGQQGGKIAWPWSLTAAGGERYSRRMGRGDGSFSLASTTAAPDDFVAHHQTVTADGRQGERVRFTAEVRGENIQTWAGIWIRAIGRDGRVLTSARTPVRNGVPDGGWHPALVELVLPSDAKAYSFGFVLAGRGTASMRKLALESSTP